LSSVISISNSSSLPQQEEEQRQQLFCYHQCTKCGMVYKCGKNSCKVPFLYDVCQMCQKRRFYFNPWFYW